ncbi:SHOCT domain-containing protein [Clostridium estertheticum]|uniref:SHOCT domain-containing protein n=1 Tax=Clostridium estertheticum TaxID=238834 RepID=UPI00124C6537|nr:SHOCT domain-containing protein [Clostridium estertheticum]MBZ9615272.1 SHOCT domain-containing protein [Clostridium estertheticum subsp. laramiense]WAG75161.1 SHOCT domain-containing protein [Clostridium estertheticum]
MIMKLNGVNGQLEVNEDSITIKRKGILSKMTQGLTKGAKTLFINQIVAVQLKEGGLFTNGYMQFTLPGGNERTKGLMDATHDENSIIIKKANNSDAIKIKDYIEKKISDKSNPQIINQSTVSAADEILKLKQLLDTGILSQDEFQTQKTKLLNL